MRFFRFGMWTPNRGLKRVPVSPVFDLGAMLQAASELEHALPTHLRFLPFPLADDHELWLLDAGDEPVALVASAIDPQATAHHRPEAWAATAHSEHNFRSPSLMARGIPLRDGHNLRTHASRLEKLVRDAAGRPPRHAWLPRRGEGLSPPIGGHTGAGARDPAAVASTLPGLPLRERWPTAEASELAGDYLDWCAPFLLTLPGLSDNQRDRFEHAAKARALAVEDQHRLYPKVLNPDLLRAIRVEARMRRAEGLDD
jgi:hypothetical protein